MARDANRASQTVRQQGRTERKNGRPVCPATGKIRYRDGREAALELKSLARRRSRADVAGGSHRINVKRKYECPTCAGWHLTSWADVTTPSLAA